MPTFSYAKPSVFQYQTFDQNSLRFTNVPVSKPPTPPPVEEVVPPALEPPGAPGVEASDEEVPGEDELNDTGGKQFMSPSSTSHNLIDEVRSRRVSGVSDR